IPRGFVPKEVQEDFHSAGFTSLDSSSDLPQSGVGYTNAAVNGPIARPQAVFRNALAHYRTDPGRPRAGGGGFAQPSERGLYRIRQRRRLAPHRLWLHLDADLR